MIAIRIISHSSRMAANNSMHNLSPMFQLLLLVVTIHMQPTVATRPMLPSGTRTWPSKAASNRRASRGHLARDYETLHRRRL